MKSTTKNNIKETILFIVKSAIFLWIARKPLFNCVIILPFLAFAIGEVFIKSKALYLILFYITFITAICLYIVFSYFTAKKLGLVKFIDKSPIWLVILILLTYEFILTFYPSFNFDRENWVLLFIHKYPLLLKEMLKESLLYGKGFIYTFIAYKLTRFLVRRYPKLSFLKKFYFLKKLENIITFKNIITIIKNRLNKLISWWKKNFRWY